jgi:hypothetical protein
MTFKIADMAHEAQLVEIADQLSEALSGEEPVGKPLDLSPDYVDAAKFLLATLSERGALLSSDNRCSYGAAGRDLSRLRS